jgi:hypothetical protein
MEALQGAPPRACWLRKGAKKLATPLGNENLAVMADLSNPRHMMVYEEFHTEYSMEFDLVVENLLL